MFVPNYPFYTFMTSLRNGSATTKKYVTYKKYNI